MARPSYSTKSNNYTTRWLKNAMKSIGASYGENIKSLAPNLHELTSAGAKTATQVARSIRTNKNGTSRINDALSNNKYIQFAQAAYRNALVDIKSGNFNNTEREYNSNAEGISDAVEEAMSGFSFGDDGADNVNVNIIGDNNSAAMFGGLSEQMSKQAVANAKMQKANMDAFVAVNAASMQQVGQLGAEVVNQLTNINSQLAAMVQYNNTSMNKYIEASMAYMERVGSSVEKLSSNGGPGAVTAMDVIGSASKGGINLGRYKSMVKQQFKNMVDNSEFGVLKTLLDDDMFIQSLVNNPLGASTRMLTSYMMPKMLKTTIEGMETTLNNFLPDMLMQVADLTKDQSSGFAGMLKRAIGSTFGIKVDRTNDSTGASIQRGAIPFDGETKHAITEIITKELRDQTGYLQIIAEHYKSNAKSSVKANAEYWDWNKNRYIKGSEINSSITNKMMETVYSSFADTYFGKNLSGVINQGKTEESKTDIENTLKEFYSLIEQESGHLDLGDMITLVQKTNGSKTAKNLVKSWLKKMRQETPNDFNNRSTAQISAQSAMKELRDEMIKNPTLYHLFDSDYANSEDLDAVFNSLVFNDSNKRNIGVKNYSKNINDSYTDAYRKQRNTKSYSESGVSKTGQSIVNAISKAGGYANNMMNSIMSGDTKGVIDQGTKMIQDTLMSVGTSISHTLFGEKSDTKFENGIFSDVANKFSDLTSSLKQKLVGGSYIDSNGTRHEDTGDTVFDRLNQVGEEIKNSVVEKLFGRTKNDQGEYEHTKHGVVDSIADSFKEAGNNFKSFLFGDSNDKYNKGLLTNVKNAFDKGFYGSGKKRKGNEEDITDTDLLGKTALNVSAGGLLGYLVGGPIVGALGGLAVTVAKNSDRFKTFLFGEEDGLTLANGKTAKKQGLVGKIGNYINADVLAPLKTEFSYIGKDIQTTIKHDILEPIAFTAEYFSGKLGKAFSFIGTAAKEGVASLGSFMGKTIANMFPGVMETGGNLLQSGIDAMYKVGASIVKAPFKFMASTVKALGIADKIRAFFKPVGDIIKKGTLGVFKFTKDVIKDTVRVALTPASLLFRGAKSVTSKIGNKMRNAKEESLANKIMKNYDSFDKDLEDNDNIIREATDGQFDKDSDEAREWLKENNPEALSQLKDSLSIRMKISKRSSKLEHMQNRDARKMAKRSDKNASKIAKWTKGQFSEDSEEAREWLKLHDPKKLKELDSEAFEFAKKQREDAKVSREGRSSRGMSETQLARANLMTMSEQGQTNSLLAKIWDILFKQEHEGKDKDEVDEEEREANFQNSISQRKEKRAPLSTEHKRQLIQEYYVKGGETATGDAKKQIIRELAERYKCTQKAVQDAVAKGDGNRSEAGTGGESPKQRTVLGSYALGDLADLGSSVFNKIKGVFSDPQRQHAKGGFLKKGLNLVGEKGAELVNFESGKVHDAEETYNMLGEASSDENRKARKGKIASLFSSLSGSDRRRSSLNAEKASLAREEDIDMRDDSAKSALDKAKNAAALKKEKDEEKYKQAMLTASEKTAKASEEGTEATKKHSIAWNKIFSKKGLITAGIIAGALLFKKFLPGVLTAAGKVLGALVKGVSWLFNLFNKGKDQTYNENGEDAGEVLSDIANNYTNGNILQLNEDGTASSLTMPTATLLGRTGLNLFHGATNAANGLKGKSFALTKLGKAEQTVGASLYKAGSTIKSGVSKVGSYLGNTKIGKAILGQSDWAKLGGGTAAKTLSDGTTAISASAAKKLYGEGTEAALAMAQDGITVVDDVSRKGLTGFSNKVKSGVSAVASKVDKKITTKLATETVEEGAENAAKTGRQTIKAWIGKFYDFIKNKFTKKTGSEFAEKGAKSVTKKALEKAVDKLSSTKVVQLVAKITGKSATGIASAAVTFGISEVAFATIGAINGVSGTAKLFKCNSDDVDGTMRLIAGILGGLTGTTLGSVIDLIFAVLSATMGVDILNGIACSMYNSIVGSDSEKAQKLAESQESFENSYTEERDAKIEEQYNTQKSAGLISSDTTLESFKQGISDGTYKVDYEGFDNYNTRVNASWGDKVISKVGSTVNSAKFGISKGWQKLVTGEKSLVDSNGNIYTVNKDGTYSVTSSDGTNLGYVSKDAIPKDATEQRQQSLLGKAVSGIATSISNISVSDMIDSGKAYIVGDSDDIKLDDSNGISANSILGHIEKCVLSPIRNVVTFGKKIGEIFGDITDFGPELGDQANSYIKGDSDDIKLSVDENNMFYPIISPISKIVKAVLSPLRMIIKAFNIINDTVSNIKTSVEKRVSDNISTFKSGASNAWDTIKGTFSNAWNYLTGGSGPGMELNGATYYSQADPRWAHSRYGNDGATMMDSGCGPAAAAMAFSDISGREITPTDMAGLAQSTGDRDSTGTNWNFINNASSMMGMQTNQTINPTTADINSALDSGRPVILSGNSGGYGPNPYTNAGHYVVAVGRDKKGNVIINDPRGASYSGTYNINDLANTTGSVWSFGGYGRNRNKRGGRGVNTQQWINIIKAVKQAYASSGTTYHKDNSHDISITVGGKTLSCRPDCSGFVSACLRYYGVLNSNLSSYAFANQNDPSMKNSGFTAGGWPGWDGLQEGDIIARNGHVEIFAYNQNDKHYVYNAGSTTSIQSPNATPTSHSSYDTVWRPGNAGTGVVTSYDTSGSSTGTSSDSSSSSSDVFSLLGNFVSSFASKAIKGFATGNYDTDYSDVFSGTSSTSTSTGGDVASIDASSANAKNAWNYLTGKGLSKAATAGILGNLQQESGIDPSKKQYGGGPGRGIAQWEEGGTRYNNLVSFASQNGKEWNDLGAQLGFLYQELSTLPSAYWNGSATGMKNAGATGTSFSEFANSSDITMATKQFEGAFERAGKPAMDKRIAYAKGFYEKYAGGGSGIGRRKYGSNTVTVRKRGGYGATANYGSTSNISNSNYSSQYSTASSASDYITVSKDSSNAEILMNCLRILSQIATNTGNTSSKLDLLKNLSGGSGSNNNKSNTADTSGYGSKNASNSFNKSQSAAKTASLIAKGGY